MYKLGIAVLVLLCVAVLAPSAYAGGTYILGDQDFADGTLILGPPADNLDFNAASAGEPAPFDQLYGSDGVGPNFDKAWTFTFPTDGTIVSATLEFGIWDHDSMASGNQVAAFTVDGVDRTSDANTAFEGRGGRNREVNVYSFSVDPTLLADGVLVVRLQLQGPGGNPPTSESPYNSAGLDFSRLTIVQEEGPPGGVPELEWGLPMVISLVAAALFIAKRRLIKTP